MSGNSLTVTLNGREFKLIGTAHVSRESIDEVRGIIREERPGMVCVELDQGRYNSITQNDDWEKLDLAKVFKEGRGFLLIANLALASFQRRLGNELGVKPGEEMKTAIETANELGLPHSLCDREVHTTLRRAWAGCGLWSKSKLLASLLASAFTTEKLSEQEIEDLKNHSELDGMMSELAGYLPGVKTVLIDERDRYLASKIWTSAPDAAPETSQKIVAVVGAGHMPGIKAHLEKLAAGEETADVSELDKIPPKGFLSKASGFIIPAVLIALVAAGFFMPMSGRLAATGLSRADLILQMLLIFLKWNSSLAALGTVLALGHPLAVVAAFAGAPIATINPLIGVGLFSGLVQAAFCKPRVSDVQSLTDDSISLKGIYRNRITRALLVFFLSTLGGAVGNFIAIAKIAGLLAR